MEIIILLLIVVLAGFLVRGLFDSKWRESAQDKIDGIKHERIFWNLMGGAYKIELSVKEVFRLYVISLTGELRVGHLVNGVKKDTDPYNLDKNIIKKNNSFIKNIALLNSAIKEREGFIKDSLGKSTFISEAEIHKKFEDFKKGQLFPHQQYLEQYDKLVSYFIQLVKDKKTGADIWEARRTLEGNIHHFEFDPTGNKKVDFIGPLMGAYVEISTIITNLLCEKSGDKETAKRLEKSLKEWGQLHMLRWCIADHSAWTIGTNIFHRAFWRVVVSVFL